MYDSGPYYFPRYFLFFNDVLLLVFLQNIKPTLWTSISVNFIAFKLSKCQKGTSVCSPEQSQHSWFQPVGTGGSKGQFGHAPTCLSMGLSPSRQEVVMAFVALDNIILFIYTCRA